MGLPRGSQDREGGHVGSKERHQKHEGPDRATGEEAILTSSLKESVTEKPDGENDGEVAEDDGENGSHRRSKFTLRLNIVASRGQR